MAHHITYPSIGQFKNAIKKVHSSADYHKILTPKITFVGAEKFHGTNASAIFDKDTGEMWVQSRERVLSLVSDNAGFCAFFELNKKKFEVIFREILNSSKPISGRYIQIYGEWCGGNIQKGVGLNHLPKQFVIFDIRVSDGAESQAWFTPEQISDVLQNLTTDHIHHVYQYKTWTIEIDFSNPQASQNELVQITNEVEADSPFVRSLLPDLTEQNIGEGVVFKALPHPTFNTAGLMFKCKGQKHSSSNVKTVASVDEEKVESVQEFVEFACTENRMEQGISVMISNNVEITPENTPVILKWIAGDIIKECSDTLVASGLCFKDVAGAISRKARNFYLEKCETV